MRLIKLHFQYVMQPQHKHRVPDFKSRDFSYQNERHQVSKYICQMNKQLLLWSSEGALWDIMVQKTLQTQNKKENKLVFQLAFERIRQNCWRTHFGSVEWYERERREYLIGHSFQRPSLTMLQWDHRLWHSIVVNSS